MKPGAARDAMELGAALGESAPPALDLALPALDWALPRVN
jgi:hypothetical protein